MNGYMGKILRVDLTTGELRDEPLNEDYARAFVGGSGLAARVACDMVSSSTDPLGPENPLIPAGRCCRSEEHTSELQSR